MLTLGNLASTTHTAGADPAFVTSYVGVGSDTIQDVFDAYSGANPSPGASSAQAVNWFTPIHSSLASKNKTVSSFDAVDANGAVGCISTKLGGGSFDRPNGSTDGINALSNAQNGGAWQKAAACAGTPNNVTGQIDFARSSRDHNAVAGTQLTFIPFARDAVSYAYFDHNTQAVSQLTKAQLTSLYTSATGSITVGTTTVKACITQQGSGTTKFWETAIGVTDAQAQAASAASGCTANPSALEENGGNSFYTFASTLPAGTAAVVDFSAGSWIAQANGLALDRSATARTNFVDLGSIDPGTGFLGKPYTGTAPNLAPSTVFYGDTTFGRNLFVVVPTSKLSGLRADPGLVSLFSNTAPAPGAAICQTGPGSAQDTANKFGFASLTAAQGTCGDISAARQAGLFS